jgi:hypothetical protein
MIAALRYMKVFLLHPMIQRNFPSEFSMNAGRIVENIIRGRCHAADAHFGLNNDMAPAMITLQGKVK